MTLENLVLFSGFNGFSSSSLTASVCNPSELAKELSQSELTFIAANPRVCLGQSINAIIDPILVLIGAAVAALFWTISRYKRKKRRAVLDSAWREVLADPHYLERRDLEERRLEVAKDSGRHNSAK